MDLRDILYIPGKPGLYRALSQVKSATIVESLTDKTKFPIYASSKAVHLEAIIMHTMPPQTETYLSVIMDSIYKKESGGPCIDPESDEEKLWKYFGEIIPDYNKEKVYIRDVRKLFLWYNYFQGLGLLKKDETDNEK